MHFYWVTVLNIIIIIATFLTCFYPDTFGDPFNIWLFFWHRWFTILVFTRGIWIKISSFLDNLGAASKPNRRLTGGSVRFRAVVIV